MSHIGPPIIQRFKHSWALAPVRWGYRTIRHVGMQFLLACGVDFFIRTKDREVLEKIILPYFARGAKWRRILFVGCAWYTRGYRRLFKEKEYSTIEINPAQARFGARRHIVDGVENIRRHFGRGDLDLIVCNGVFGWGLNDRQAVERAFRGCFECLRDGGVLVIGWNDLPGHTPFPLETCEALKSFTPWIFPSLDSWRYMVGEGRHTYVFYLKGIDLPAFTDPTPLL